MQKIYKKGFTLIELLVVIAIIGILAGIVLASLSTARGGANDAKVKEQLSSVRTQAEIFYGNNGNRYGSAVPATAVCPATAGSLTADATIQNLLVTGMPSGTTVYCGVTATTFDNYAVAARLSSTGVANDYWCVDSTGASRLVNIAVAPASGSSQTTCAAMDLL
ncbi:prepilin-type N-terminal cleavage/methylation domain-containing protein [Acetobacteraceae bacterium]|nr:prepilin-type N-terminal cleavage/methylation domain-containing protein [Candidatus Parcubacteria bacterium]